MNNRPKTQSYKTLEDDIGENLGEPGFDNDLLINITSKAWPMKEKNISWISLKFKTFVLWKILLRQWRQAADKGLVSKI